MEKTKGKEMVIPADFNLPKEVAEIRGRDGRFYLQFNTGMVTLYRQTYGELSFFFQALKEGRLIGSHCRVCGQVMVPAATWHCPNCNFAEMEEIELPHQGVLAATAPITIFPSASFIGQAPFCRGYVDIATEAPIASFLPIRLRTTTGLPRPGIFVKGIQVKIVFEDEREGSILDIFGVPMDEVPQDLREKEPLLASELSFETPSPPRIKVIADLKPKLDDALRAIQGMADKIQNSPRAQKDIAGRKHLIGVKTGGGDFGLSIANGQLEVIAMPEEPDFVIVAENPGIFANWAINGSLTDAVIEGLLWLPDREAFKILPVLDRIPRSIRRDLKE